MQQLLQSRDPHKNNLAVLFVDLDHFKHVNDNVSHAAGNSVLVATAERLRQIVRPDDTVARLSGDEFLVICPGVDTQHAAEQVAERILATLTNPVRVRNDSVFLTASIGITLAAGDADAESLIAAADTAMYHAKRSGRAHYEWFDHQLKQAEATKLRVENELHEAIEQQQLRLYFQPIVKSDSGAAVAVEALARWQHPVRGLLPPSEFIPIAEESGLIVPLGTWVLEEACRCANEWCRNKAVTIPLRVSVNLSARQLTQLDLVANVERILAGAQLDPKRVEFGIEVTESVAMRDVTMSTKMLQALRTLGVRLSIDDFGTGYSSLAYLKRLAVDTLKVDMSFIREIATDRVDQAIVATITGLGKSLGLDVVAEGVETREQAQVLREIGVMYLQGFLYARPMPLDALVQWLAANRRLLSLATQNGTEVMNRR